MVLVLLALLLILADLNWPRMRDARSYLSLAVTPLQWLADVPGRVADDLSDLLVDRSTLLKENEQLKSEQLLLERRVQQVAALTAENIRLRELLEGKRRVQDEVMLAELIGVNPDPFLHQVLLNRGTEDGAFVGQAVLDAGGVSGQVIATTHYTSRVMLITDARHAIPVEINRNGFRAIALGKGTYEEIELEHVPDTADVREGDLLITSGLGGRFPRGYPVAVVTGVLRDPGKPFSMVTAKPTARLDKSRHLLLVKTPPSQRAEVAGTVSGAGDE